MFLDAVVPDARDANASVAVWDRFACATYAQLASEVEALACALERLGVERGDHVAIRAVRTIGTVTAMLATLRCGACYVPIGGVDPERRQQMLIKDSAAKVLVIPSEQCGDGRAFDCTLLHLESGVSTPYGTATMTHTPRLRTPRDDSDAAYMLYTSGSTGLPKGVVVSHHGALAFVEWAAHLLKLSPRDRVLGVAPFHFDLSIFDIFATLMVRAQLTIGDDYLSGNPARLLDVIREHGITVLYTVPSILVLLTESNNDIALSCRSLRTIVFAGEVFPIQHLKRLMRLLPETRFHNFYGPTETNVCASYSLPRILDEGVTEIPIGVPACGVRLSILDCAGRPVADQEIGELHVEGATVMLGYWRDGRLHPPGTPYPTGDQALRRADGQIMFRGRRDTQIKIRGHRVDLLEVERVLGSHPMVRECAVSAVSQRLIAFVCASSEGLSVLAAKQHAAAYLPPYMVPSLVYLHTALPRHANGKLDREQLEAIAAERLSAG